MSTIISPSPTCDFKLIWASFLCGAQIEKIRRILMLHIYWKWQHSTKHLFLYTTYGINKVIWVWPNMMVTKWWQNRLFWRVNCPFNPHGPWMKKSGSDDITLTCNISEIYRSERSLVSLLSICQMKIWMYVKCDLRYVSLSFLSSPADCSLQLQYSLKHQCCFEA